MENPAPDAIVVLKIKNMCCTAYQKKLNKEIHKLDGVISISINPCQSLVSIRGKLEPEMLLNVVAKTGKYAELVYLNKNPSIISDNHHNEDSRHGDNVCNGQRWMGKGSSSSSRMHTNCCHEENMHREVGKKEEEHKRERYIPPPMDERMCGDYYGRGHSMMRPIFSGNSHNFGYFPHHATFSSYPKHRYDPSAYGYRSGRLGPGMDAYGSTRWWGW